jgi:general stress protein 26
MNWEELTEAAVAISWVTNLATADDAGRPHVAAVSVGFTQERVWFASRGSSRKIRNLHLNQQVALHWPVVTGTGPGELFMRGTARLHDSEEARRRLWTEANLAYDPAAFFQTPDNPDLVFVEIAPTYASLLGPDFNRDTWRPVSA